VTILGLAMAALASLPARSAAQSRQPFSLQGSGAIVFPTEDYGEGLESGAKLGWEVQARYTFGRFSIGAGYQRSTVFKADEAIADLTGTISVGFLEPRYVLGVWGERAAPYVAARLGYGGLLIRGDTQVTEESVTYGGGLGLLYALAPSVSLDVGAQYFQADFAGSGSAGYFLARLGASVGLF
jgi:predicted porin